MKMHHPERGIPRYLLRALALGAEDLSWQDDSLCTQMDAEMFFPEKGQPSSDAKAVCGMCSVRAQCLEYALNNDVRFGVWGGLSARELAQLRKQRDTRTPDQSAA